MDGIFLVNMDARKTAQGRTWTGLSWPIWMLANRIRLPPFMAAAIQVAVIKFKARPGNTRNQQFVPRSSRGGGAVVVVVVVVLVVALVVAVAVAVLVLAVGVAVPVPVAVVVPVAVGVAVAVPMAVAVVVV